MQTNTNNYIPWSYTYSPKSQTLYTNTSLGAVNINITQPTVENILGQLFESQELSRGVIDALFADSGVKQQIPYNKLLSTQHLYPDQIKKYILPNITPALWCTLFDNQDLNDDLIALIDLDVISQYSQALFKFSSNTKLSFDYIERNKDKLDWRGLITNNKIIFTKDNIIKYIDYIHRDHAISDIFVLRNLSTEELNDLLVFIYETYPDAIDWDVVSWSMMVSDENVFRFLEYLDFKSIYLLRHYDDDRIRCYIALTYPDLVINEL